LFLHFLDLECLEHMLWLSLVVFRRFVLLAPEAGLSTLEVVVLALVALPATIREVEVVLLLSLLSLVAFRISLLGKGCLLLEGWLGVVEGLKPPLILRILLNHIVSGSEDLGIWSKLLLLTKVVDGNVIGDIVLVRGIVKVLRGIVLLRHVVPLSKLTLLISIHSLETRRALAVSEGLLRLLASHLNFLEALVKR